MHDNQGLNNALNGLGGGGQLDPTTSANSNATLYATFAAAAFFSGYLTPLVPNDCAVSYTFPLVLSTISLVLV